MDINLGTDGLTEHKVLRWQCTGSKAPQTAGYEQRQFFNGFLWLESSCDSRYLNQSHRREWILNRRRMVLEDSYSNMPNRTSYVAVNTPPRIDRYLVLSNSAAQSDTPSFGSSRRTMECRARLKSRQKTPTRKIEHRVDSARESRISLSTRSRSVSQRWRRRGKGHIES